MKVAKIFKSLQGESTFSGYVCMFIRLAGCNLRCRYCDTVTAQEGGSDMAMEEIIRSVDQAGLNLVEVTGGEPLFQEDTPDLVSALLKKGYQVLVETNGSLDISLLPEGAVRIMDIKCPSSGEQDKFLWDNIWRLTPDDEVKFVLSNRHDYEWACGIVRERFEVKRQKILFSPVYGELPPRKLVEWMIEDRSRVRLQLQLHKHIWPPGGIVVE
jgi:7-carboxy-7-deazaguanine synthase